MILTAYKQTVNLDLEYLRSFNRIGLSLSGGADSAILFLLLSKYAPDIKLLPWCAIDVERPFGVDFAREIHKEIISRFPDNDIRDLYTFEYDIKDPKLVKLARENESLNELGEKYFNGFVKQIATAEVSNLLISSGNVGTHINGLTANPPREECERLGFIDLAEERRFSTNNKTIIDSKIYKPFRNVNKKWIRGMYEQHDAMDWLYPLTQSCIGFADKTDFFTKPCKQCFWCHEKHWAFGTYDLCFDK